MKAFFQQPPPRKGQDPERYMNSSYSQHILPYAMGNVHPRFWGWVIGTGTPMGVLAEMLAATMNPNAGGGDHAAFYVEQQVIDWFVDLFGLPKGSSGLLVSGCSMANLVGLTVARNVGAGLTCAKKGCRAAKSKWCCILRSKRTARIKKRLNCWDWAAQPCAKIAVNDQYQMDIDARTPDRSRPSGRSAAFLRHRACRHGQHRGIRRPGTAGGPVRARRPVVPCGRRVRLAGRRCHPN
jgi:aromatic-L-amino-acid/L-tryptophan decarboxylase